MKYRLYIFDGNLKSFESTKHNICGWYEEYKEALTDFERAKTLYDFQFVLVETKKGHGKILAISK